MRVHPRFTAILSIAMAALVLAACRNVGSGSAAPLRRCRACRR